jgi:hypothetical protein
MPKVDELVTELLAKHNGHKKNAAIAAGINISEFGKVSRGKQKLSDGMRARIQAHLNGEAIPPAEGRTVSFDSKGRRKSGGGRKLDDRYQYPPLLAELLAKFDGRHNRAAAAMGYRTSTPIVNWAKDHSTFDELAQLRVSRALRGEPPPSEYGEDEPDEFKDGTVYGLFPAANFERALDAAEAFNGKIKFKIALRTEWFGVWKMQEDKARLFKKLMARDALKITCP